MKIYLNLIVISKILLLFFSGHGMYLLLISELLSLYVYYYTTVHWFMQILSQTRLIGWVILEMGAKLTTLSMLTFQEQSWLLHAICTQHLKKVSQTKSKGCDGDADSGGSSNLRHIIYILHIVTTNSKRVPNFRQIRHIATAMNTERCVKTDHFPDLCTCTTL